MAQVFNPRSQCDGKVRYFGRRQAKEAIADMRAHGRHVAGLSGYRCPHCGFFHLGHRPPMTAFELRRSA